MSEPFVIEQQQADNSYKQLIPLGYINRNEFDNGYFISSQVINQRGVSGTISAPGYFIDRWKLVSGTVTLTANGLTLNGTIAQILSNPIGTSYSVSVGMYSGTATVTYDNNTATGNITSAGGTIKWAKLEIGEVVTPFVPKGVGAELAECLRYFRVLFAPSKDYAVPCTFGSTVAEIDCPMAIPMRIAPSLVFLNGTEFGRIVGVSSSGAVSVVNVSSITLGSTDQYRATLLANFSTTSVNTWVQASYDTAVSAAKLIALSAELP